MTDDHRQAALDWAGDDPNTRAIVHALVYIGDQIATNATERASNRLLTDDGAERELVDTPTRERRAEDVLAFLEKEGTR